MIGPHAGFRFSGATAAWAYINVNKEKFKRVILLGPSHKVYFDFIATTACTEWETPLGNIEIDTEVIKQLISEKGDLFQQID